MYVPLALAVGTLFGVAVTKTIDAFKNYEIKIKEKKSD